MGLTALNVYGGDTRKEFIIETSGDGAIVFDYDNDGWPDIFLPNGSTVDGFPQGGAPTGPLYHNNRDGTLTDVTTRAGLARSGWAQGGCVGDYDNDTRPIRYLLGTQRFVPQPGRQYLRRCNRRSQPASSA